MEVVNPLEYCYFLARSVGGDFRDGIDWALERQRRRDEGHDPEVIMLAAYAAPEEARSFTELVLERYSCYQALDLQLAGGKYLAALRDEYLRGNETVHTLDSKLQRLYAHLQHPGWLSVLCRNCRHARAAAAYRVPFEKEFAYLARLWSAVGTRAQFQSRYNHAISRRHDGI